jgi:hypothetical protein
MKKQYKLKHSYPGSPDINSIYEKIKGHCGRGSGTMYKNLAKEGCCLDANEVENNPEYWEEVIDHSIMLECIKRFPKGTKVKSADTGEEHIVANSWTDPKENDWFEGVYYYGLKNLNILAISGNETKGFYLYHDGKFAEAVVEKDYEILTFKYNNTKGHSTFFTENSDGLWSSGSPINYSLPWLLKEKSNLIHSVKRLSDGEVFTVGEDYINTTSSFHGVRKIENFNIIRTKMFVNTGSTCLKSLGKVKKPLFKTEDSADIYKGDSFFWTNKNGKGDLSFTQEARQGTTQVDSSQYLKFATREAAQVYINSKNILFTTEDSVDVFEGKNYYYTNSTFIIFEQLALKTINYKKKDNIIRFSTKAKVEEYILMNKPCLSLNDVFEVYPQFKKSMFSDNLPTHHAELLINKVKSS